MVCIAGLLLAGPVAALAGDEVPPDDLWHHDTLGWQLFGVRPWLLQHDQTLAVTDIEEALGNPTGGMHRGGAYDGATLLSLQADLDDMIGWTGASLLLVGGELRGHGLSGHAIGNLMTVSTIEVQPETRLFDLTVEQSLADGALSLRAGQMAAAEEFFTTRYAVAFLNSSFAWPVIAGADLPGEDPATPLSTPGARLRVTEDTLSWQAGIFAGAANALSGPPEARAAESTGDGALLISEAAWQFAAGAAGTLPGTLKLGGWYHTAEFDDLHLDRYGQPLLVAGDRPRRHQGDWGAYAVAEMLVWRVPDSADRGIGAFLRGGTAPGDRNLISSYLDAGLIFKGPPGRPADLVGLGVAWAGIGRAARQLDGDWQALLGDYPRRDGETALELTWQLPLAPWWTLQPDLQWIVHPGGHAPDFSAPSGYPPIADALVVGLRSTIRF